MTRRAFLALPAVMVTATPASAEGFHVTGRLMVDTSDLAGGYFVLCGTGTGQCQAKDAIAISVHPENALYAEPLNALVGRDVQVSIVSLD